MFVKSQLQLIISFRLVKIVNTEKHPDFLGKEIGRCATEHKCESLRQEKK